MTQTIEQFGHFLFSDESIYALIQQCLEEDGAIIGDVTTCSIIDEHASASFDIRLRGSGVIAGLSILKRGAQLFEDIEFTAVVSDGDVVTDQTIALVSGNYRTILIIERLILNIMGYASGIATQTKKFVDRVAHTPCLICDTRKTTPGLRLLDKYAVVCGGGTSHRIGLHDAALYKDNHLAGLTDLRMQLADAIKNARESATNPLQFVEIEVDSIEQLNEVIDLDVDFILLDNMSIESLEEAVAIRNERGESPLLEASGGVTLSSVGAIAETGVDRIAIGGLTHQSTWLDFGLDVQR